MKSIYIYIEPERCLSSNFTESLSKIRSGWRKAGYNVFFAHEIDKSKKEKVINRCDKGYIMCTRLKGAAFSEISRWIKIKGEMPMVDGQSKYIITQIVNDALGALEKTANTQKIKRPKSKKEASLLELKKN